jgi:hypothetical protein
MHNRLIAPLISNKVVVIVKFHKRWQWLGVLDARDTWWLNKLIVIHAVVNNHVQWFSQTTWNAGTN